MCMFSVTQRSGATTSGSVTHEANIVARLGKPSLLLDMMLGPDLLPRGAGVFSAGGTTHTRTELTVQDGRCMPRISLVSSSGQVVMTRSASAGAVPPLKRNARWPATTNKATKVPAGGVGSGARDGAKATQAKCQ